MKSDLTAVWGLLTSSYLNLLLLSVPLGYMAQALGWAPLLRFGLVSSIQRSEAAHPSTSGLIKSDGLHLAGHATC